MRQQKISSELRNAMSEDAERAPPRDRLEKIKRSVVEMRDLEMRNAELEEQRQRNSERLRQLRDKEVVDLLDEAGLRGFTVAAEGNMPQYEIEITPYYHAVIPEDTADEAYEWLRKRGHGDLIKAAYTVEFGRGQEKQQAAFEKLLNAKKIAFSYKFGVPWNTLTAFVREQIEVRKAALPLKLLGATVGRVAKVVKQKKERK